MAEIREGILGGIHGKLGPVVGFMWRGRYYLRTRPGRATKPASEKQILSRSKLGLVSTFASKFKDFVNRHCPPALLNGKMASGKEQLISMLTKEGVVTIDGMLCIDIAAVILSLGTLPPAVIKKINLLKTGRVKVAWDNSITNLITKGTDRLTLVAYHEGLEKTIEIESIGKREDKFVHFDLPKEWIAGNVHFWSVWKSADGVLVSTSAYHGIVSLGDELENQLKEGAGLEENNSDKQQSTSAEKENNESQNRHKRGDLERDRQQSTFIEKQNNKLQNPHKGDDVECDIQKSISNEKENNELKNNSNDRIDRRGLQIPSNSENILEGNPNEKSQSILEILRSKEYEDDELKE